MAQKELKWYDILSILFGIILGFADPITDILTLIEFYRADHKTWFMVGLAFILLPSVLFSLLNMATTNNDQISESWCRSLTTFLFGCNPLFPAFMKLRTLFAYLKKLPNLWRDNQIEPIDIRTNENELNSPNDIDNLLEWSKFAFVIETAVESAPQFIIQLYAIVVQQESVTIIQMVSLPVSFLSLAWASTVADDFIQNGLLDFSVKDKVVSFSTHLFTLSSRLFAVAFFTVRFKWFVCIPLIFHCLTMWTFTGMSGECGSMHVSGMASHLLFICESTFYWILDDCSFRIHQVVSREGELSMMILYTNVLFLMENIIMILLFYFLHFPRTWYSLPVTICVCLFAFLGFEMRVFHFYLHSRREQSTNAV